MVLQEYVWHITRDDCIQSKFIDLQTEPNEVYYVINMNLFSAQFRLGQQ